MKVVAIIQARMGSTRLPNKVMKKINSTPMIDVLLARLSKSLSVDKIVVATSINPKDKTLADHVIKIGYDCYKGNENDVLERYYMAACKYKADIIVRITADCPLVDCLMVDEVVNRFKVSSFDYVCNNYPPTFPDGLDIEVFNFKSLKLAYKNALTFFEKEHVTPYIRNNQNLTKFTVKNKQDLSHMRWTVDEKNDFLVIEEICNHFSPNIHFNWIDILRLEKTNPEYFTYNKNISRNEGDVLGKGQKLYKRAKNIIPGGNMLLSKRPEMFLPEFWPSYYSKAKGCEVWDLDGKKFFDMSIMGIGTNILGYGHSEVDNAVKDTVSSGNMSTLNCPEEVWLAEKLIEIHPWADMVRFARSGGEANAIAVRIARAASGRDNVAICGYHGWHDWYLATNLMGTSELGKHLLPGLNPEGVPKTLKESIFSFQYNNFEELQKLINEKNIGVIIMEVLRNEQPKNNFLEKIRAIASKENIVLIFDECTSGFRETYGGIHKKYNVYPDIAMFGKALGNGYGITAVVGKREIMEAAQNTFISSTFWTERIGPSAALKTLEVMEKTQSWDIITSTGKKIKERWLLLAKKHNVEIQITGIDALASFNFKNKNHQIYKTFITQEMLKKGFLAANSVYVCIDHTKEIVDNYFDILDGLFKIIKEDEKGTKILSMLDGPISHNGFTRLN